MTVLADDQMIKNFHFQQFGDCDNLMGEMNICDRRLRIAGRMIVDEKNA